MVGEDTEVQIVKIIFRGTVDEHGFVFSNVFGGNEDSLGLDDRFFNFEAVLGSLVSVGSAVAHEEVTVVGNGAGHIAGFDGFVSGGDAVTTADKDLTVLAFELQSFDGAETHGVVGGPDGVDLFIGGEPGLGEGHGLILGPGSDLHVEHFDFRIFSESSLETGIAVGSGVFTLLAVESNDLALAAELVEQVLCGVVTGDEVIRGHVNNEGAEISGFEFISVVPEDSDFGAGFFSDLDDVGGVGLGGGVGHEDGVIAVLGDEVTHSLHFFVVVTIGSEDLSFDIILGIGEEFAALGFLSPEFVVQGVDKDAQMPDFAGFFSYCFGSNFFDSSFNFGLDFFNLVGCFFNSGFSFGLGFFNSGFNFGLDFFNSGFGFSFGFFNLVSCFFDSGFSFGLGFFNSGFGFGLDFFNLVGCFFDSGFGFSLGFFDLVGCFFDSGFGFGLSFFNLVGYGFDHFVSLFSNFGNGFVDFVSDFCNSLFDCVFDFVNFSFNSFSNVGDRFFNIFLNVLGCFNKSSHLLLDFLLLFSGFTAGQHKAEDEQNS